MQEAFVLSVALNSGALQTDVNAVLAQTSPGWTNWSVASSFCTSSEAYVIFVRTQIPTGGGSPYVT